MPQPEGAPRVCSPDQTNPTQPIRPGETQSAWNGGGEQSLPTRQPQGLSKDVLGERLAQLLELRRNGIGNRPLHMGAHAHAPAPLRLQTTDTWIPPYTYSHQDAREGTYYTPAILSHPMSSPSYHHADNPMDPPIAPEIVSEATGTPMIHRVTADNNRVVRETADIFHQNLPARQNDWDALPTYHPRATAGEPIIPVGVHVTTTRPLLTREVGHIHAIQQYNLARSKH